MSTVSVKCPGCGLGYLTDLEDYHELCSGCRLEASFARSHSAKPGNFNSRKNKRQQYKAQARYYPTKEEKDGVISATEWEPLNGAYGEKKIEVVEVNQA